MIEPFFFADQQLFGIYQAAQDPASDRAVVICPPLFDEYRRSYRALSDLAAAYAQLNFHVLRFDYRGTGDSQGELGSVKNVAEWIEDIERAVDELEALSGAREIALVSLRAGALLASSASQARSLPLIAWDPMCSGAELLSHLQASEAYLKADYQCNKRYVGHSMSVSHFAPFDLDDAFIATLGQLNWQASGGGNYVLKSKRYHAELAAEQTRELSHAYDWPLYEDGLIQPREAMESLLALTKECM